MSRTMLKDHPTSKLGVRGGSRLSLKIADVEYRIRWDATARAWKVLRNGVATAVVARKKRTSAIASAIRDAKLELEKSNVTIVVTCLDDRKLESLWKGRS